MNENENWPCSANRFALKVFDLRKVSPAIEMFFHVI